MDTRRACRGLASEFLLEMRERTLEIADAPLRYPVFGGLADVRCAHAIGRFPHLIAYIPFGDAIHVLAFMHPRRRPGYWSKRGPLRR